MNRMRAGIIGMGFIGPVHIDAIRRLGYVDVAAVTDINQAEAEKRAKQFYIPKAYGDWQALLADETIDVIHVCTPNYLHYSITKAALEVGKHVLCEKPLALTVREAEELVLLAKKNHCANAIHFVYRFYPIVHHLRQLIAEGNLGVIFAVNGSYLQDWLLYKTDYSWRLDPSISGNSRAFADIGSHWCDMAQFLLGARIQSVMAQCATVYPVRIKPKMETRTFQTAQSGGTEEIGIETEDYVSALLRFDNGVTGNVHINQMAAGRKNRLYIEIFGTKGSVGFDAENPNELWTGRRDTENGSLIRDPALLTAQGKQLSTLPAGHPEGFFDASKQLMNMFYQSIRNADFGDPQKYSYATFQDGLDEIQLCEAILRSNASEKWEVV